MRSVPILLLLPLLLLLSPPAHAQLHWPQRVEASFAFRNVGEAAVRITGLQSSCGCTTAGLEQGAVRAGGGGRDPGDLHDRRAARGRQSKTILVRTDHAAQPVTRLTLTVNVPERVTLSGGSPPGRHPIPSSDWHSQWRCWRGSVNLRTTPRSANGCRACSSGGG